MKKQIKELARKLKELGEMLPREYQAIRFGDSFMMCKGKNVINGGIKMERIENTGIIAKTEANARAKCLIYLIEKKIN